MKKIKYEKPILYGLDRGSQDAEGMGCSDGSSVLSNCTNGSVAVNVCTSIGTWSGGSCAAVGNMPSDFYSICGTGSGNSHGCGTGGSAAGGCYPTGNST